MIPALVYHDIAAAPDVDSCGFSGPVAARYKLAPDTFEAHLDALQRSGIRVGLVHDRPSAVLTFDDGGASALLAAAALERRRWRGYFFITTGRIGTGGFLDADGVRELVRRGHEVGSHSHSHPTYMGALDRAEIAREWRQSREALTGIVGAAPSTAAVPGGFLSPAVIEEAQRAGYEMLMTSTPSLRASRYANLLVHGRFTIWATTSPARAARYARGNRRARAEMWLAWKLKSGSKRLNQDAYEAARQVWARRRPLDR